MSSQPKNSAPGNLNTKGIQGPSREPSDQPEIHQENYKMLEAVVASYQDDKLTPNETYKILDAYFEDADADTRIESIEDEVEKKALSIYQRQILTDEILEPLEELEGMLDPIEEPDKLYRATPLS